MEQVNTITEEVYFQLNDLMREYIVEIMKINKYIMKKSFGYNSATHCPSCNIETNYILLLNVECIIPYHVSLYYTQLCKNCISSITNLFTQIQSMLVGKYFKVARSNGDISVLKVGRAFTYVREVSEHEDDVPKEIEQRDIQSGIFLHMTDNVIEKTIPFEMIYNLNKEKEKE